MTTPYREDFIAIRREDVKAHGRLTPDMRLAFGVCSTCVQTFPIAVDPIDQPAYASVDELVVSATRLAEELAKELAGAGCPECDATLALTEIAYHAWHTNLEKDVVVRWRPGEKAELFTWALGAERVSIVRLAPADEQRLVRSAALRADAMGLDVFLFLNDKEIASFGPGVEPKLVHLVFDAGAKSLLLLLSETIVPEGKALPLDVGDVVAIEVTHPSGRPPVRSGARSRPKVAVACPRFELTIDDAIVATVGEGGGFSLELQVFDEREEVEVALHAQGREGGPAWALPLLGAGQTVAIRVLGPGLVDVPEREC